MHPRLIIADIIIGTVSGALTVLGNPDCLVTVALPLMPRKTDGRCPRTAAKDKNYPDRFDNIAAK